MVSAKQNAELVGVYAWLDREMSECSRMILEAEKTSRMLGSRFAMLQHQQDKIARVMNGSLAESTDTPPSEAKITIGDWPSPARRTNSI